MLLRITIDELDARAQVVPGKRRVLTFRQPPLVAGSAEHCDVPLPGLPDIAFTIARGDDGSFRLEKKAAGLALRLNENDVPAGEPVLLRNSDHLAVPGQLLSFGVEFERAPFKTRWFGLPLVTVSFVVLIAAFELSVISWLPRQIQRQELWARDIARQRVLRLLDRLRRATASAQAPDDRAALTLRQLRAELDQLALYLMRHQDELEPAQLNALYEDLAAYERIRNDLVGGKLYPPPTRLDLDAGLRQLLPQEPSRP